MGYKFIKCSHCGFSLAYDGHCPSCLGREYAKQILSKVIKIFDTKED